MTKPKIQKNKLNNTSQKSFGLGFLGFGFSRKALFAKSAFRGGLAPQEYFLFDKSNNVARSVTNRDSEAVLKVPTFKTSRLSTAGFSIIELLIYMAVLVFMIFVVFSTISTTRNAYRTVKATRIMHASALSLFDRMGNEIRSAYDINLANSSLANGSGSLALTKDVGGGIAETKFYIDNGVIMVSTDAVSEGSLTSSEMTINSLRFDVYSGTLSKFVSVVFNASVAIGDYTYNKEFQNSYVLRGSY